VRPQTPTIPPPYRRPTARRDLVSGALVETSTYYPNGARESYRAPDGGEVGPEPAGFTGKEGDEEVGLTYFGERYLVPRIGRWASPDPLWVHAKGGGEALNAFHYVSGNLLQGRDPLGLECGKTESCDQTGGLEAGGDANYSMASGETVSADAPPSPSGGLDPKAGRPFIDRTTPLERLAEVTEGAAEAVVDAVDGVFQPMPVEKARTSDEAGDAALAMVGGATIGAAKELHATTKRALTPPNSAAEATAQRRAQGNMLITVGTFFVATVLRALKGKRYQGGAYKDIGEVGDGLDNHHMPADSITDTPRGDGPAITMDPLDHRETSSWGSSLEAQEYRASQADLLEQGRARDAMAREIRDVRRVAREAGDPRRYNQAMQEMLDYAKEAGYVPPLERK